MSRWWLGMAMKLSLYTVLWWPPPPTISKPCSQVGQQSLTLTRTLAILLEPVRLMCFFYVILVAMIPSFDCFFYLPSSCAVSYCIAFFFIHEHFHTLTRSQLCHCYFCPLKIHSEWPCVYIPPVLCVWIYNSWRFQCYNTNLVMSLLFIHVCGHLYLWWMWIISLYCVLGALYAEEEEHWLLLNTYIVWRVL